MIAAWRCCTRRAPITSSTASGRCRWATRIPTSRPTRNITTATCEIFVATGNDRQFRKLCEAIGRAELADDPRFRTNSDRLANRPALIEQLAAAFAAQDGHALCDRLIRAGYPAGPVMPVDEALAAAHTAHRQMVTELDGYRGLGTPIKLSRTPGGTRAKPPKFGADAEAVLAQHGYGPEEIAELRELGVLHEARRK